jgi:hypothetical protein
MFEPPRTDFWQVGIVPAPIQEISVARLGELRSRIVWLPHAGPWRYLADPFGLELGDALHVFVEAFDYRTKHGVIERHEFALADMRWRGKKTALARPFHLSYPFVFEHRGSMYMVPETHQAREIALYRATDSLDKWKRECVLMGDLPAADASLIQHQGLWWMFYTLVGPGGRDQRELHVAWSPRLDGPWQPCRGNPVRIDRSGARPAGRPFHGLDGALMLPVQDCSDGYGSAVRLLRFIELRPAGVLFEVAGLHLTGDLVSDDHTEGFHTLSACGPFTLIDVKRIDRSRARQWLDLRRRFRRLAGLANGSPVAAG